MPLSEIDRQSKVWVLLKARATEKLETLRKQNDGDLDPQATAKIRGRILELNNLLAWGEGSPEPTLPSIDR